MQRTKVIFAQPFSLDRETAINAARAAFDQPEIAEHTSLAEAQATVPFGGTELIAVDLSAGAEARAVRSTDDPGLARWAVVGLGDGSLPGVESVPPEEWSQGSLTRVFRYAAAQHEAQRMNLKLRGDLMTVARRIGHDLRSPISCIRTNADLLKEITFNDAEMLKSTAVVVQESVDEAIQLLDRVAQVLSASSELIKFEPVDCGAVVANVLARLRDRIASSGAVLTQPSEWPTVPGGATALTAIWTNLVENCLVHAGKSPRVQLGWEETATGIRFTITDSGPGVNPARRAEIFAPFEQLHRIRTRGFGLAIVRRLVELHGGSCGWEAPASGGSLFHFTLPAARSKQV